MVVGGSVRVNGLVVARSGESMKRLDDGREQRLPSSPGTSLLTPARHRLGLAGRLGNTLALGEAPEDHGEEDVAERYLHGFADAELRAVDEAEVREDGAGQ